MFRILAALAALFVVLPSAAAAQSKGVYNKEGYWEVAVVGDGCGAALFVEGGRQFILQAVDSQVNVLVGLDKPARAGRELTLNVAEDGFSGPASLSKNRRLVEMAATLPDEALTALKTARQLVVSLDGRELLSAQLEGTGLAGALDAVIACSEGESGWWGQGAARRPKIAKAVEPEAPPLHKAGYWSIEPLAGEPGACTAAAKIEEGSAVVFFAAEGGIGLGVTNTAGVRRGRKGVIETEGYQASFTPAYEGDDYFFTADFVETQTVFVLRRAKGMRVTIDGREAASVNLEGTGIDEVLTDLVACARGEKGWWGDGAPQGR